MLCVSQVGISLKDAGGEDSSNQDGSKIAQTSSQKMENAHTRFQETCGMEDWL